MSLGYAAASLANTLLDARAKAGDDWMRALGQVADVLVRPEILQVADVSDAEMDVFGHMVSPMTPGMNTSYARDKASPFGIAA